MRLDRNKLIRARERLGYSLEVLGEEAGTSKNSALRAEHEEDIRPGTARKIAKALGVEVVDLMKESDASKKSSPRPKFFELPGLDAALKRHGMSRSELAFRVGMTPGEILDYEIGAKNFSDETVNRLAEALGAARYELVFPPEQVEVRLIEEKQEKARFYEERTDLSASEILKERANPASRRVRDGYEKLESERQAERDRKDKPA